jgi:hypothetical protein
MPKIFLMTLSLGLYYAGAATVFVGACLWYKMNLKVAKPYFIWGYASSFLGLLVGIVYL